MSLTRILLIAAAGATLAGCVQSQPTLSSDFGVALRQDLAAQIADPDARYGATPSDGAKAAGAQDRYRKGVPIAPSTGSMAPAASGVSAPQGQ